MARVSLRWIPLLAAFAGLGLACDRPPSVELKEWTAADHGGEQQGAATGAQGARGGSGGGPSLVAVTWNQQCATCHGGAGKGDGPQGPMFKAPDLSRADWQDATTDEAIAQAITKGKGRMPSFDLPEDTVRGLVEHVRAFRER